VKVKAEQLGVEVAGFGIRDIILPGDVKEIMNKVLIAEKMRKPIPLCVVKKLPALEAC
jgi:regulator of protease activity HflC (stomatin/prohibitin superfamily)